MKSIDTFEFNNGVKMPSSKILSNFSKTLFVHLKPVKTLSEPGKYEKILKNESQTITDEEDHFVIIFENSIPTVSYKGYVYKLDYKDDGGDSREFQRITSDETTTKTNEKIYIKKSSLPQFLAMNECWGITLDYNNKEFENFAYCCRGKSEEEILRDYSKHINQFSQIFEKPQETILRTIMNMSKHIDFHKNENTPEYGFFKNDPLLKAFLSAHVGIHVRVDSDNGHSKEFMPALLYYSKTINKNVFVDGAVSVYLSNIFNEHSLEGITDIGLIVVKSRLSTKQDKQDILKLLEENHKILVYTRDYDIQINTDFGNLVVSSYSQLMKFMEPSKIIPYDSPYTSNINGSRYINISNTHIKDSSFVFQEHNTEIPNITISIKSLQIASKIIEELW